MITQKYHIKEDSWLIRLDRDWITFNYELSTRLSQGCNIFGKSYKKKVYIVSKIQVVDF